MVMLLPVKEDKDLVLLQFEESFTAVARVFLKQRKDSPGMVSRKNHRAYNVSGKSRRSTLASQERLGPSFWSPFS
jgi:hypothetical protein